MTDDITLRSPGPDELKAFFEPLLLAFAEEWSQGEFDAEQPILEPERLVNAFDGDRRVGTAGAFSMRLTVPGGEVAASGITAVGVSPDQRRRGVMRRMLMWLLDDARSREEPVAVLWASEAAIYQRFGFGSATISSGFEADRARLAFRDPRPPRDDVRIRLVDADEGVDLATPIYEAVRASVPGTLDRPEAKWRNMLMADPEWSRHGNGPKFRAVLEVDGEPRGYVIYRVKSDWTPRGPAGSLMVAELFALDPDAEQRLWQWVLSMDLVTTVKVWRGPMPHPLQSWLQEPRRLGLTVNDGLWLRFVDVATALAARTYAGEGTLVLEVKDTLIEANAGRWLLSVGAGGTATVTRTSADPDLVLDVAALASAYLGTWRFSDLAATGRVRALTAGAIQMADVLFLPPVAPHSNTMF
jgi:predicted acetyltransferase